MQIEILATEITTDCHCTVEQGCTADAIAIVLITKPDGEPQTCRYLCLQHLNELSDQLTSTVYQAASRVLQQLRNR